MSNKYLVVASATGALFACKPKVESATLAPELVVAPADDDRATTNEPDADEAAPPPDDVGDDGGQPAEDGGDDGGEEMLESLTTAEATWEVYYGNLHAHTSESDGSGTPKEAFDFAKTKAELDFLSITEHNHYASDQGFKEVVKAAGEANSKSFAALVGQEFSVIADGNHLNIHGVTRRVAGKFNRDYRYIYEDFIPCFLQDNPDAVVTVEFNHPHDGQESRDYGIKKFVKEKGNKTTVYKNYDGNWKALLQNADPWVNGIAILNGPSDYQTAKDVKKGELNHDDFSYKRNGHRDTNARSIKRWFKYLDRGFHLAPSAHQDNHMKTWGNRTAARTAVWLDQPLTYNAVLRALRDRRAFATEDHNLSVWFSVDDEPMGSRIKVSEERVVELKVVIEDDDEPDREYKVELLREVIGDGKQAKVVMTEQDVKNGAVWTTDWTHKAGVNEALIVHVWQTGTKDDAWTAPIWLETDTSEKVPKCAG